MMWQMTSANFLRSAKEITPLVRKEFLKHRTYRQARRLYEKIGQGFVDNLGEGLAWSEIKKRFKERLCFLGEELLKLRPDLYPEEFNLVDEKRPVVLVDMLDGTVLHVRDLGNWCSAMVFFHPQRRHIYASVIGDSFGTIYWATDAQNGAFLISSDGEEEPLRVSLTETLDKAQLAFVGQTSERFFRVAKNRQLVSAVERIYNLGGNPMLVKVADGSMDIALELVGQKPHDCVPGLFIAQKAGAVVRDMDCRELNLIEFLLYPNKAKIKYIAAATESLYEEIRRLV